MATDDAVFGGESSPAENSIDYPSLVVLPADRSPWDIARRDAKNKQFRRKMKATLRNSAWFVAFLGVGILAAFIAMGQALGGGLDLSVANTSYSVGRGLAAGMVFGFGFLLFWLGKKISSTRSRFVELVAFAAGWYLAFYIHVAACAAV